MPRHRKTVEAMVEREEWLVYRVVRKHYPWALGTDVGEDLLQEGRIGLWQAAKTWDPKVAKFPTFAARRIRGQIQDFLRMQPGLGARAQCRQCKQEQLREGQDVEVTSGYRVRGYCAEEADVERLGQLVWEAARKRRRNLRDAQIITDVALGESQAEAAGWAGVSAARVSQIVERSRPYVAECVAEVVAGRGC